MVFKERIWEGASGSLYKGDSSLYPNCVFKKGLYEVMSFEALAMRNLNHPNIVKLFAEIELDEVDKEGRAQGCLALQRLGPSLETLQRENKM